MSSFEKFFTHRPIPETSSAMPDSIEQQIEKIQQEHPEVDEEMIRAAEATLDREIEVQLENAFETFQEAHPEEAARIKANARKQAQGLVRFIIDSENAPNN